MRIPHAGTRLDTVRFSDIPFDHHCSRCWANCGEHNVCNFHDALRSFITHSNDDLWVVLVLERWSFPRNNRPRLANKTRSSRNSQRGRNDVEARVKKYDLAVRVL